MKIILQNILKWKYGAIFVAIMLVSSMLYAENGLFEYKTPGQKPKDEPITRNYIGFSTAFAGSGYMISGPTFEWALGKFDDEELVVTVSAFFDVNYHTNFTYSKFFVDAGIGTASYGKHWGVYGRMMFLSEFSLEAGILWKINSEWTLYPFWKIAGGNMWDEYPEDINYFGCRLSYELKNEPVEFPVRALRVFNWQFFSAEVSMMFSGVSYLTPQFRAEYNGSEPENGMGTIRFKLNSEHRFMDKDYSYMSFDLIGSVAMPFPNYDLGNRFIGYAGGIGLRYGRDKWSIFAQGHIGSYIAGDFGFSFVISRSMSFSPQVALLWFGNNMVCTSLGFSLKYNLP